MCNLSQAAMRRKTASVASYRYPAIAIPPLLSPHSDGPRRKRWTTGELTEILDALSTLRTEDIARKIGVNPKALRSVLRRNGISLRALRERTRKIPQEGGLIVRRSTIGPFATYGAAALERLAINACHWPIGDPADPDFKFCGEKAAGRSSYCQKHLEQAFQREESR